MTPFSLTISLVVIVMLAYVGHILFHGWQRYRHMQELEARLRRRFHQTGNKPWHNYTRGRLHDTLR